MISLSELQAHHKTRRTAPQMARCPNCGAWSPCNEVRSRHFWVPDLLRITIMELVVGCYLCPVCPPGKRWFAVLPQDFNTASQYSVTAQQLVVDLIQRFKLSAESAAQFGREVLHLDKLNATTVLEWLREAGKAVDLDARRKATLKSFSGQMAIDEVYDGQYYQLKATDPLNDLELKWRVGQGSPTKEDIRQFLQDLKDEGFQPILVVTDGSDLYPDVIQQVWPNAQHQRCVFHFIQQINRELGKVFWKLYATMPKPPKRKRGRPKKRGRPRLDKQKRENRRKVRKARFLILKRDQPPGSKKRGFTDQERAVLEEALALCPALKELRRFVVLLHELFGPTTKSHQRAQQRREAILSDPSFAEMPGLSKILDWLRDDDLFERLTRYLDFTNAEKTSNHVERENREYRKRQKGHYRLRSLSSICALLDLLTVRKPIPGRPRRLRRKPKTVAARKAVR